LLLELINQDFGLSLIDLVMSQVENPQAGHFLSLFNEGIEDIFRQQIGAEIEIGGKSQVC